MKRIGTYVLLLILLAMSVTAATFEIVTPSLGIGDVNLTTTSNIPVSIEIRNPTTETIRVIMASGNIVNTDQPSYRISYLMQNLSVAPNQSRTFAYNINLLSNQFKGLYSGNVVFYVDGAQSDTSSIPVSFNILPKMTIQDTIDSVDSIVVPTTQQTTLFFNWTLKNTGNDIIESLNFDDFSASLQRISGTETIGMDRLTGSPMNLNYNSSAVVRYQLIVPVNAVPGTYQGYVRYTSNALIMQHSISVVVLSNQQVITFPNQINDNTVNSFASDSTFFNVVNDGNVPVTIVLPSTFTLSRNTDTIVVDPEGSSNYIVPIGGSKNVELAFNPLNKPAGTYTGNFSISYSNITRIVNFNLVVTDPQLTLSLNDNAIGLVERNVTKESTIVVKNTGSKILINPKLTVTSRNTRYGLVIIEDQITGSSTFPNGEKTFRIRYSVPNTQNSGSFTLADVTIKADNLATAYNVGSITAQTETNLEIKSVKLKLEDTSYDEVCNEDEYDCSDFDIEPGKKLSVYVKLKNTLEDRSDIDNDMEDVQYTVTIKGIEGEDGDDIEKDSNRFKISAGKDGSATIVISLPSKFSDSESFDMEITASANVNDGPDMDLKQTIKGTLNYDRENEDVRITNAYLSPEDVTCDRTSTLRVTIANFGSDDLDEARIVAYSDDINLLDRSYTEINLASDQYAEDNEFTATYAIKVPSNYNGDTVKLTVWAFHGTSDSDYENYDDHIKELTLNVESCSRNTVTTTTRPQVATTYPNFPTTTQYVDQGVDYQTTETPFTESPMYIAILALVFIVVLGFVITMIIKAVRN